MARLVDRFRSLPHATDAEGSEKVQIVADLEDLLPDARVLRLFTSVVADAAEYDLARIECIKILRLHPPTVDQERTEVGRTIAAALQDDEDLVCQYAAMSLGPYARDTVVFDAVAEAVLDGPDPNVRHGALSSIREAGKDDRSVRLLQRLTGDAQLGKAATRILDEWGYNGGPAATENGDIRHR